MKLKHIGFFILGAVITFGCGKFNLNKITYKVVPSPLEYHGDSIKVVIEATYPKKTLPRKASAELTPVLKYKGGEKSYKTLKVKGDKSKDEGSTLNHKEGGTVKYSSTIAYVPGMEEAELHVKGVGTLKGKEKYSGMTEQPIALGTIVTPLLTRPDYKAVYGAHNYGPIILTKKVNLYFPYNSYNIRPSEKDTLKKGSFNAFVDFQITDGGTFKSMDVNGWASPDGEEGKNNELSTKRADEVKKFVEAYIKEKKLTLSVGSKGNGEDMSGFNSLVASKNFEGMSALVNQIKGGAMNKDLKGQGTGTYNQFEKEILSPLRKAEVTLVVQERQKTNDELVNYAKNDPAKLTLEELLYTSETLISDDATKISILEKTAQRFPQDWRATNNIGAIYLKQGKLNEALTKFQEAEKIDGNQKAIKNNIGAAYMMKGDKVNAEKYFKMGSGSSENSHNLGSLYILQGKYSDAVSAFGSESSFNAALAKLLAGNPEKAPGIIDASTEKDDAISYYLKAIAAARTNSNQAVIDNLKTAIQKDSKFKDRAKWDLEFLKMRDNADFKALIN